VAQPKVFALSALRQPRAGLDVERARRCAKLKWKFMKNDRYAFIANHAPLLLQQLFRNEGSVAAVDLPKYVEQCVSASALLFDRINAEKEKEEKSA
jgi:hypothetical protein